MSHKTKIKIFCILIYICGFPTLATAQIVPDATLPNNSTVTPNGNTLTIEGGTEKGTNLFHSFREFSVPTGGTAFFNNINTIQNIFTRVTGGSISNIDGILKANGNANLFIINPNGIIFGPNASLNIGGSFLATTANRINFADGSSFSAINPEKTPLLTISIPTSLQFAGTPAEIRIQGPGHNFSLNDIEKLDRGDRPAGLAVAPGNTLAIAGGNVILDGGNLIAEGGRIELWSVSNGQLTLDTSGQIKITAQPTAEYGDIQLVNAASADASGSVGGTIQVQGRNVSLTGGSAILTITEGAQPGSSLTVNASKSVEIIGTTTGERPFFRSGLLTDTQGDGNGSSLTINTGRLTVREGAVAQTSTFAGGNAGNLTVLARDSVEISSPETADFRVTGGLSSGVAPDATGNGGNLTIETGKLLVQGQAQIATTTKSAGQAGDLTINATDLVQLTGIGLLGISGLFANAEKGGNGGNLTINTRQLIVEKGAEISTSAFSSGKAGDLLIRASDSVEVRNGGGIFAQVNGQPTEEGKILLATGNGGNLTVETRRLTVESGGRISATTFGERSGGTLTVKGIGSAEAELVEVIGALTANEPSRLSATTEGSGAGGNVSIDARRVVIRDGGQVTASTLGPGLGGSITVNATDSVELSGIGKTETGEVMRTEEGEPLRSGLLARSRGGSGDAGSLNITTQTLKVEDGATLTVSSRLGTDTSAAGNLKVEAGDIRLDNGIITAETFNGDRGNIDLNTSNSISMRDNSNITVTATGNATGGNITINTRTLAAALNSDITANANNQAGIIKITAPEGIFGTRSRREINPNSNSTSDITTTSQTDPRLDGETLLNTPDIDPTQGAVQLPDTIASPDNVAQICPGQQRPGENNTFTRTGRGLPGNPGETLTTGSANVGLAEAVTPVEQRARTTTPPQAVRPTPRFLAAQGWAVNRKGEVIFTANPATVSPYNAVVSTPNCNVE